jgi:small subunit ribosomal protein S20
MSAARRDLAKRRDALFQSPCVLSKRGNNRMISTFFPYRGTMANIESAKKRARQSEVRRTHNASLRSRMRTAVKRVRKAIADGDKEAAQLALRSAASELDSSAGKKIVHRNMAARNKSRLATAVKAMA